MGNQVNKPKVQSKDFSEYLKHAVTELALLSTTYYGDGLLEGDVELEFRAKLCEVVSGLQLEVGFYKEFVELMNKKLIKKILAGVQLKCHDDFITLIEQTSNPPNCASAITNDIYTLCHVLNEKLSLDLDLSDLENQIAKQKREKELALIEYQNNPLSRDPTNMAEAKVFLVYFAKQEVDKAQTADIPPEPIEFSKVRNGVIKWNPPFATLDGYSWKSLYSKYYAKKGRSLDDQDFNCTSLDSSIARVVDENYTPSQKCKVINFLTKYNIFSLNDITKEKLMTMPIGLRNVLTSEAYIKA